LLCGYVCASVKLYNFAREDLARKLPSNPPGLETPSAQPSPPAYFSFLPHPKWRIIVLDPYDISTISPASGNIDHAFRLLQQNNPNDLRLPGDWLEGLTGVSRRWVPYNGGLGDAQLAWLDSTLRASEEAGVRAIVLSHVAVCPGSSADSTLVWNYDAVMGMFEKYACVAAFLCGHDHNGGYKLEQGVHHVTVESPLECELGETAYGLMVVNEDCLTLHGSVGRYLARSAGACEEEEDEEEDEEGEEGEEGEEREEEDEAAAFFNHCMDLSTGALADAVARGAEGGGC